MSWVRVESFGKARCQKSSVIELKSIVNRNGTERIELDESRYWYTFKHSASGSINSHPNWVKVQLYHLAQFYRLNQKQTIKICIRTLSATLIQSRRSRISIKRLEKLFSAHWHTSDKFCLIEIVTISARAEEFHSHELSKENKNRRLESF